MEVCGRVPDVLASMECAARGIVPRREEIAAFTSKEPLTKINLSSKPRTYFQHKGGDGTTR
jgi:hypothetical protein